MNDLILSHGLPQNDIDYDWFTNRSFTYGDGFFETLRAVDGNIPLWDYHWARMTATADFLGFDKPNQWSSMYLKAQCLSLTEQIPQAALKIIIFRSGKGKYHSENSSTCWVIRCSPSESRLPRWPENGLKISLHKLPLLPSDVPYSWIKKTAALPYILADDIRVAGGWDELLLHNTDHEIAEAVYHNIFLISERLLITPPLASGCVSGVMRAFLQDHAKLLGFEWVEKPVRTANLYAADEIFLSNAYRWIQPVSRLENHPFKIRQSVSIFDYVCQYFVGI